ncbi:MAG: GGDEF domain-containing protein [Caryophanon sp.]|nr:GGDEF domain-containing protein [Caryophanon sp.]
MQLRTFMVFSIFSFGIILMRLGEMTEGESLINEKSIFILNILLIGLAVQHFVARTQRLVIEQDLELKESVAESNRLMAALVQANEALTKQAMYDNLTMIPNRNGFYMYATGYIQQHEGEPLTLLMMDVDYFKQYNDFYNHVQGDCVLYKLAQIIQGVVAQYDGYVARWGGEEFLVMTTPAHAENICRDIQEEVANAAIVHERSAVSAYVTISIGGFSSSITSAEELNDFYKRADVMLYEVKQHGRNHYRIEEAVTANT